MGHHRHTRLLPALPYVRRFVLCLRRTGSAPFCLVLLPVGSQFECAGYPHAHTVRSRWNTSLGEAAQDHPGICVSTHTTPGTPKDQPLELPRVAERQGRLRLKIKIWQLGVAGSNPPIDKTFTPFFFFTHHFPALGFSVVAFSRVRPPPSECSLSLFFLLEFSLGEHLGTYPP